MDIEKQALWSYSRLFFFLSRLRFLYSMCISCIQIQYTKVQHRQVQHRNSHFSNIFPPKNRAVLSDILKLLLKFSFFQHFFPQKSCCALWYKLLLLYYFECTVYTHVHTTGGTFPDATYPLVLLVVCVYYADLAFLLSFFFLLKNAYNIYFTFLNLVLHICFFYWRMYTTCILHFWIWYYLFFL